MDKISVKNDDSVYVVFLLKILFIILINDLNIKNKCFTGHPFTFSSVSITSFNFFFCSYKFKIYNFISLIIELVAYIVFINLLNFIKVNSLF